MNYKDLMNGIALDAADGDLKSHILLILEKVSKIIKELEYTKEYLKITLNLIDHIENENEKE
jgi:hypothetical protein